MARVDKILDVIDVGLQHAGDVAYDWDTGACLRCGTREPAEGSAWCVQCRPRVPTAEQIQAVIAAMPSIAEAFQAMFDQVAEFMRTAGPLFAEVLAGLNDGAHGDDEDDCSCEFDPIPGDPEEGTAEDAWHYRRTCGGCGHEWYSLHCPHDGYQNPCPACGWKIPRPGQQG